MTRKTTAPMAPRGPSTRTARPLALLVAAGLALTACTTASGSSGAGGHEGHGDSAAAPIPPDARGVAVVASSFAFTGGPWAIAAGEPIALELLVEDGTTHDFTIDEVGFHVAAEPGENARALLVVDEPGTYTAYCSVPGHREAGMEAEVTVTA